MIKGFKTKICQRRGNGVLQIRQVEFATSFFHKFDLPSQAGILLFTLLAGESVTAFMANGGLSFTTSRGSPFLCASRQSSEKRVALRMGYLDNINSGNSNMQGKDKDGKQVMPSFEEYLEVHWV